MSSLRVNHAHQIVTVRRRTSVSNNSRSKMNLWRTGTSQELVAPGRLHAKAVLPGFIQKDLVQLQFNSSVLKSKLQRLRDLSFHSLTGNFPQRNYARKSGNLTVQHLEKNVISIIPVWTDLINTMFLAKLIFLVSIAYQKHRFQKNVTKKFNGNSLLKKPILTHAIAIRMAIDKTSTALTSTHHLVPFGKLKLLNSGTSKPNVIQILIVMLVAFV